MEKSQDWGSYSQYILELCNNILIPNIEKYFVSNHSSSDSVSHIANYVAIWIITNALKLNLLLFHKKNYKGENLQYQFDARVSYLDLLLTRHFLRLLLSILRWDLYLTITKF